MLCYILYSRLFHEPTAPGAHFSRNISVEGSDVMDFGSGHYIKEGLLSFSLSLGRSHIYGQWSIESAYARCEKFDG